MKTTKKMKDHKSLRAMLSFDLEDMELDAFMWPEDRDPPPTIKGRIKIEEKDGKQKN